MFYKLFFAVLYYAWYKSSDAAVPARPSRHTAPTSKLTDANNTAQPELSFQHKAVQAFHTRRAQENMLGQDPSMVAAGSAPPSMSPPKCNIDMSGSVEPSEDEDIDDQPRPHMSLCV